MVPESYTCSTSNPYEKGEMFNIFRSVASEAPTLSPGFRICTTLGDFSWDTQSLKERSLLRTKSRILSRNDNAQGCNGSCSGRCAYFILQQLVPHFDQIPPCENESHITTDMRQQLFQCRITFYVTTNCFSHHGIFPHQYNCISA
ncbi:hypothetical protein X777_12564 [Ooceraea biroi]|uniref:Uncharacterized protein n=1 Tax=Ooceraea biroi TaxID=2015173 RepID=A0A026W0P4_OOCBI|nr:hypothetical protein X777_12564 [Ooceraea biroi]